MKYLLIYFVILLTSLWLPNKIVAQSQNHSLSGYISNMQSVITEDISDPWLKDNLFHNRLQFQWYPSNSMVLNIELRNRFFYSDFFDVIPAYAEGFNSDDGFFDLSKNVAKGSSFLLNSKIDRAYLKINKGKWDISLGRQRINYGQCFAWNPNDIFNTYSYFDFDYVEKPGSDALRIQFYPGMVSRVEWAIKLNSDTNITTAFLYQFNQWGYDIQFLGGLLNSEDYMGGFGFSGNIKQVAVRGEASYFIPKNKKGEENTFVASLGFDHTFSNSLSIQLEGLYNPSPSGISEIEDGTFLYNFSVSPKQLSFSEESILLNLSFPASPLLNVNMSTMFFPEIHGYYFGPGLDISMADNLTLSLIGQIFKLHDAKIKMNLFFLRMKYNF